MAVKTTGIKDTREEVEKLIEQEKKLTGSGGTGLLNIITVGLNSISGFVIDTQRKKETTDRIAHKLEECTEKLRRAYESTNNPMIKESISTGVDVLKGIYAESIASIERTYASKDPIDRKLVVYNSIETAAIEEMDITMEHIRKIIS